MRKDQAAIRTEELSRPEPAECDSGGSSIRLDGIKAVHLSSVHGPFTTRIFRRECRSLARAGAEVVLIVPGEHAYESDGVRIRGVPKSRNRLSRMTITAARVIRAGLSEQADVYHVHAPELIPGALFLRALGKTVIFDAHEDLAGDIAYKHYLPKPLKPICAAVVNALYRVTGHLLSGIVVATPRIAERFPRGRTTVVQNFPEPDELTSLAPHIPYEDREPVFAYVGDLTEARGAFEMVSAIGRLGARKARLELAGRASTSGVQRLLQEADPRRVKHKGWQDRAGVADLLGRARAGLCLMQPYRSYREAQPVKLFEYMAMGLPVIVSDFPEWRELIGRAGCAIFVDPTDSAAIANAMAWVLDNPEAAYEMGMMAQRHAIENFEWKVSEHELILLYKRFPVHYART